MAKIELSKVREHNLGLAKQGIPGNNASQDDIKDTLHHDMETFTKSVATLRSTSRTDNNGRAIAQSHASFSEFITARYGLYAPEGNKDPLYVVRSYMKALGVRSESTSFQRMAQELGVSQFDKATLEATLLSTDVANGTTFIIREVIMEAIRLGMLGQSKYQNWTARSIPMADMEQTVPQILKGEGTPKYMSEGETHPMGFVRFGQKKVAVRKVGTGLEITDELVWRSSIDMISEFLMTVGEDTALAKDVLALDVLKNGEQADLSENAPIVGVDNVSNGIKWNDILRVTGRLKQLGHMPDRTISDETLGLLIAQLPEFQGYDGMKTLSQLITILGAIPRFEHDIHGNMAANIFMFLDPRRAMYELKYRSMMTEKGRDPDKMKDVIYITDFVGFMIARRDARVILKSDLLYNATAGQTGGFPTYMDISSYTNNPFRS